MNLKKLQPKTGVYSNTVNFSFCSIGKLTRKVSPLFFFSGLLFLSLYLLPVQEAYAGKEAYTGIGINDKGAVVLASIAFLGSGLSYFFYDAYFLNPSIQLVNLPEYYIEYKLADHSGNLKENHTWIQPKDFFDGTHEPEEAFFLKPDRLVATGKLPYRDKTVAALKTVVWKYGEKLTNEADRKRFRDNLHAYSASCIGVGKLSPYQQLEHSLSTCISSIVKQSKSSKFKNSFAVKAQTYDETFELAAAPNITYPVFQVTDSQLANLSLWITAYSVSVLITEGSISLQTPNFPVKPDESQN